jgi:signal transduction histidine kinase
MAQKFRWILILVVLAFIVVTYLKGHFREATYSLIPAGIFFLYNLYLGYLIRAGKNVYFLRYFSVTIDLFALSLHIYINSVFFSSIAVSTTATILIYPILIFLSVLRYDRKLIIYSTGLAILFFNINYYIRLHAIEPELMAQVISSDPMGHTYKSGYLLLLGIFFLQIPDIIHRYINRQMKIMEKKNESEIKLALESKEKQLLQLNLGKVNVLNSELNEKNLKIEEQNQQLNVLNNTKDRLLSFISHDLKDSFSSMGSIIETLKENHHNLSGDDMKEATSILYRHSRNNYQLFNNILEWARSQSGQMAMHKEVLNLSELIGQQYEQYKLLLCNKKVRFKSYVSRKQKIFADREMFGIILDNLISNAYKFTPTGGEIEVDAVSNKNYCLIKIKDTGIGIPEEHLDGLFEIGHSSYSPGTNGEPSSGFGLILCKELIQKNGGEIHVKSKIGEGSIFSVTLPNHV